MKKPGHTVSPYFAAMREGDTRPDRSIQENILDKENRAMTITRNLNGTNLEIALEGRLDTMTAPELEAELSASMNNAESLTLDFSKLEYISSAGLRVLLFAHKVMSAKGGMKVLHVNEIVSEVFEVTGFADILTIE